MFGTLLMLVAIYVAAGIPSNAGGSGGSIERAPAGAGAAAGHEPEAWLGGEGSGLPRKRSGGRGAAPGQDVESVAAPAGPADNERSRLLS